MSKQIASYTHPPLDATVQEPDARPGDYYVTVIDGTSPGFLLGPYVDDHVSALTAVNRARAYVQKRYPRAAWWSFGTSRLDSAPGNPLGKLNGILPMVDAA